MEKIIGNHRFDFGDQMYLYTEFLDNGDNPHLLVNQRLEIADRMGRRAAFEIVDFLPETLRELADELEEAMAFSFNNKD